MKQDYTSADNVIHFEVVRPENGKEQGRFVLRYQDRKAPYSPRNAFKVAVDILVGELAKTGTKMFYVKAKRAEERVHLEPELPEGGLEITTMEGHSLRVAHR